ncbi:TfpX/TfpZ family type IV pilin accessory protein [Acinetobacter sp. YH16040_T]|uniref:TfpX/TfpZ family type IV pilin accessory protein n=1 Tax=unclassified Acinetobacter TaxID=196816 RepID=UPI0015D3A209|nr:TfpX/TfpZ family type IV pilin accessory protein [Acinetobacter sp. YH16040_T]UUS57320.1 type IV pilin accessory protein [Acinetobacter sp. YH16040_T]
MSKRFKFFLHHLSISFLITSLVMGLVFFIWYPTPLATAVGVTNIFLMLLVIDVILGPLLGLLVYKEGKKTLKFDLSVIVLIQIAALGFGVYSIAQGRPVWIAYNVDRFELVRKNEMITDHIEQALPQFQDTPWFKPQWVGVEFAKDANTRSDDLFAEALGGISIAQKPERYIDFSKVKLQLKQRTISLTELNDYNDAQQVDRILSKYPQATAFVPLKANSVDMTVLVNKETGEVVKIVDLRPWK